MEFYMKKKELRAKSERMAGKYTADFQIADFDNRSYPIFYGKNIMNHLGHFLDEYKITERIIIISHPSLKKLFNKKISRSLPERYEVTWALFPSGEKNKNADTVHRLYDKCVQAKIDKNSAIVALGGGVVQDVANYVAATYMRGVPFVQIPTTLLSQADIGVGGCSINHNKGKSLIGQFHQPCLVLMDSSSLKTLPKKELRDGIAELINKVICLGNYDSKIFSADIKKMLSANSKTLQKYIKISNKVKIKIIEKDETGISGHRFLLDWGHTITYALEKVLNYSISHGTALGIGMHGAATLSHQLGFLQKNKVKELEEIIKKSGLPTKLPKLNKKKLLLYMRLDKKNTERGVCFILLKDGFGKAMLSDAISDEKILSCLDEISA